jgi:hypothetical protein
MSTVELNCNFQKIGGKSRIRNLTDGLRPFFAILCAIFGHDADFWRRGVGLPNRDNQVFGSSPVLAAD